VVARGGLIMEEDKFVGKLHFSFTSDLETTTLDKVYHEEPEYFETIYWFVEEFKYFLKSMGFSEHLTDRVIYLENDEKVVNSDGEVLIECKIGK
jgi:hypothetical protein